MQNLSIRFLGTGNAYAQSLGNSACVLENSSGPLLLIDCGHSTINAFESTYPNAKIPALFVTHAHYDHIGGLERLFYRLITTPNYKHQPKFFCPVELLPLLQQRIANYPSNLAEGGVNFWDAFHLIPVADGFWYQNMYFNVFPVRHHNPNSAFGITLRGHFFYSGDTKPIPEILVQFANSGEIILHDCGIEPNPAHTALSDLHREYKPEQWQRMILYHYESEAAGTKLEAAGFTVAKPNTAYPLVAKASSDVKKIVASPPSVSLHYCSPN